jgi:hypothetical protein
MCEMSRYVCVNLYLSMEVAIESEVADTGGSTTTPAPAGALGLAPIGDPTAAMLPWEVPFIMRASSTGMGWVPWGNSSSLA